MVLTLTPVCHDSEKNASRYYCVDMVEGGLLGHTRYRNFSLCKRPKTHTASSTQHTARRPVLITNPPYFDKYE